jgi:hypothetical protein
MITLAVLLAFATGEPTMPGYSCEDVRKLVAERERSLLSQWLSSMAFRFDRFIRFGGPARSSEARSRLNSPPFALFDSPRLTCPAAERWAGIFVSGR